MTADEGPVRVDRNDAEGRYEVRVGVALAGFTEFEVDAQGRLVFPHTQVDPAFSGRGLASTLVGAAMADVASRGETVVPLCPFVARYLHEHEVEGLDIDLPPGRAPGDEG
ncbi:GNAT family N-acetyltransferase [Microbacterium sp. 18062]|uniref:GNAT family N-acetyltransferase n=1 Tax=Microbacterium sp. 18062 TaxID=2681410 RepID=UPI00135AF1E4|nr:GNAT family N-acetyltransferase [Microbacterium sp. 18062]